MKTQLCEPALRGIAERLGYDVTTLRYAVRHQEAARDGRKGVSRIFLAKLKLRSGPCADAVLMAADMVVEK